ncbi:type II/IV secretion system protein [bacterium]|nr:type II/IV secretion system protein [bacterium]
MPDTSTAKHRTLQLDELLAGLRRNGLLTERACELAKQSISAGRSDKHLIAQLDALDLPRADRANTQLTAEAITAWLAEDAGLPYARIDPLKVDVAAVTAAVPYAYAARAKLLPLAVNAERIKIATAEPWQRDWVADLEQSTGKTIEPVLANPIEIERYLVEFYALSRSVHASQTERGSGPVSGFASLEQLTELGRKGQLDANDRHVVNIVDWLLQYAFEQRASDIHMEPRRDAGRIRFRIDGVLHDVYQVPASVMTAVTSRVKILGRMNVAEKRRPQDGRIKTRSPEGQEIELRLSTMPTAFGEKLVMRVFDPDVLVKNFAALGFNDDDEQHWRQMTSAPNGIVLVTGPTGSGKTTTLYSTLKQLATPQVNICTIEDPIELVEPSFNQMQVQTNIDVTFASGVRTVLRQDPDIIMVGEIRDLETAEIATQAALTGHLVLSTLHTNDAPSALTRLMELGVPAYLIRATLLGVVGQRLVRQLCPHCKSPVAINAERWATAIPNWPDAPPTEIHEPIGCLECRETGYLGRVGIYEVMPVSQSLSSILHADIDLADIRAQALKEHMLPLRIAGGRKVAAGETSLDEVVRVSPPGLS